MDLVNIVTRKPKSSLFILFCFVIFLSLGTANFDLDASSETLLLENDPDLKLYRDTTETYGSTDFLVVTVAPHKAIFEKSSIETLKRLTSKLLEIEAVEGALSLLDVPLIEPSEELSLSEVADQVTTLNNDNPDLIKAKRIFSSNEVYKNLLISEDLKTTAIQLTIKRNLYYENLLEKRYKLYDDMSLDNDSDIELINEQIKKERLEISKKERALVEDIRLVLAEYAFFGELFLGGASMITVDTIDFISQDLITFGIAVFLVFLIVLSFIFKTIRWVAIPLSTALFSSVISIGVIGWLDWKVTVVSANFVSIVMIISLSLAVHLIVRYQELNQKLEIEQKYLVQETMKQMFLPCLYTALTTMVAFASLTVSDIKPLIDFGFMMIISIVSVFILSLIHI